MFVTSQTPAWKATNVWFFSLKWHKLSFCRVRIQLQATKLIAESQRQKTCWCQLLWFLFCPVEIMFAITSMIFILLVVFIYSQSTITCSELAMGSLVRGVGCIQIWQWRHQGNDSWSRSDVFIVNFAFILNLVLVSVLLDLGR